MTTALTSATLKPTNLGALIEAQGETLAATSEQATRIFKENQKEQQKTIDAQSKLIEELQAILIKERGEKEQVERAHVAALNALKNKKAAQVAKTNYDIDALFKVCDEISQLQADLPHVLEIAVGKHIMRQHPHGRIGAYKSFPGGTAAQYIAYYSAKVQGRYDPQENDDVTGNLTAETRRKIDAIKANLKSIKEEIKK